MITIHCPRELTKQRAKQNIVSGTSLWMPPRGLQEQIVDVLISKFVERFMSQQNVRHPCSKHVAKTIAQEMVLNRTGLTSVCQNLF